MESLLEELENCTQGSIDVLIQGETGTGKEIVARTLHASSPRAAGPFVATNCAAIPSELLEAELFGIRARVATGVDPRPGLLSRAHGGTIFFDEIGDMPEPLQAKLLRALQEREVTPLGAREPEKLDIHVISSTNRDLARLVDEHRFRADLYYRLRGAELRLPPLRERSEDVAVLALAFAERAATKLRRRVTGISKRALRLLETHTWPGNVRELKAAIERAVLRCPEGAPLSMECFSDLTGGLAAREAPNPATPTPPVRLRGDLSLADRVGDVERAAIVEALEKNRGNRSAAARDLRITRNGLALKMRRLGIR
jgi:transcriptional regulator with PAS, ATPase and Fis domain